MFLRLWNIVRGYVEIEVTGFSVARFVNMAVHREIYIWDVRYFPDGVRMKVSIKGFKMLRESAIKTRCKIKIIERKGLPFLLNKYKKRKFLALGIIFLVFMLYFLSSFVWVIDVSGNETIETSEIIDIAKELGLKSGDFKYFVKVNEVEKGLQDSFSNISWIDVHIKGTEATIKITESLEKKEEIDKEMPTDVVALKDGLITNMVTITGTPLTKQKDVVKKGDVLVTGRLVIKEEDGREFVEHVHSEAEIYAKMYYEINFNVPFKYEEKVYTDEIRNRYSIKIMEKKANVPWKNIDFDNYDKYTSIKQLKLSEKYPLPIIIYTDNYKEFNLIEKERNMEQAKEAAVKIINSRIVRELDIQTDVVDKKISYEGKKDGIYVSAVITTIERIDEKKLLVVDENDELYEKDIKEIEEKEQTEEVQEPIE